MGYRVQNNHNFNITINLFIFTAWIKAILQYTYFISLPFASPHWHGFESRNRTIGRFDSSSHSLLDFEHVVYHEYVCVFIDERK